MDTTFIFENRKLKNGDAVITIDGLMKDTYCGPDNEFYIDNSVMSEIKKMYGLMYVYDISDDTMYCKIQTKKGTQGIKNPRYFPSSIFKIVKVPKMADVVAWLYDNQLISYPVQWSLFKNDISSISRYIVKIFQTNLKAIFLINKYNNHLYSNNEPEDVLIFYKTLIQQMRLQYHKRYDAYNPQIKRKEFIKIIQELDPLWHTNDCVSLWEMNNKGIFSRNGDPYISNVDRIERFNDPKKFVLDEKTRKAEFEKIRDTIMENERNNMNRQTSKDSRFIPEINQKVIDDLELVIFNVKTIPTRNQILIIFIDKDNNKRFHLAEFSFEFFVSSSTRIVENDYIMDYDPNIHTKYIIKDMEILKTLKFAVNDNHKRFMKIGKF